MFVCLSAAAESQQLETTIATRKEQKRLCICDGLWGHTPPQDLLLIWSTAPIGCFCYQTAAATSSSTARLRLSSIALEIVAFTLRRELCCSTTFVTKFSLRRQNTEQKRENAFGRHHKGYVQSSPVQSSPVLDCHRFALYTVYRATIVPRNEKIGALPNCFSLSM